MIRIIDNLTEHDVEDHEYIKMVTKDIKRLLGPTLGEWVLIEKFEHEGLAIDNRDETEILEIELRDGQSVKITKSCQTELIYPRGDLLPDPALCWLLVWHGHDCETQIRTSEIKSACRFTP